MYEAMSQHIDRTGREPFKKVFKKREGEEAGAAIWIREIQK